MSPDHVRGRAVVLLLLVAVLIGAAAADEVHSRITAGVDFVAAVTARRPIAGTILFVVLAAISAMAVAFSTAVVVPVAIVAWGRPLTLVLLWLGWLIGGSVAFAIGRYPGRRLIRWLVTKKRFEHYEAVLTRNASFPLVLLFVFALPSELPGYILGSIRCRFRRYLAALAITELPFAVGAVYLGDSFLKRDFILLIGLGLAGAALSIAALHLLQTRIRRAP